MTPEAVQEPATSPRTIEIGDVKGSRQFSIKAGDHGWKVTLSDPGPQIITSEVQQRTVNRAMSDGQTLEDAYNAAVKAAGETRHLYEHLQVTGGVYR